MGTVGRNSCALLSSHLPNSLGQHGWVVSCSASPCLGFLVWEKTAANLQKLPLICPPPHSSIAVTHLLWDPGISFSVDPRTTFSDGLAAQLNLRWYNSKQESTSFTPGKVPVLVQERIKVELGLHASPTLIISGVGWTESAQGTECIYYICNFRKLFNLCASRVTHPQFEERSTSTHPCEHLHMWPGWVV